MGESKSNAQAMYTEIDPEISLINLSKGEYVEFCPAFGTKRNNKNLDSIAESTLKQIIEEKKNSTNIPIIARKRKLYEQYKDNSEKEKVLNSIDDDITKYIINSTKFFNVPITLRKRLLYQKLVNT